MKKLFLIFFGLILIINSCINIDFPKDITKVEINPRHEISPPIATNIFFKELQEPDKDGNNLKFIAEFEKDAVKGNFLALNLNDEKVVLRDDGKGADEVKGDNKFSINIKDDVDVIKNELGQRQKLGLSNGQFRTFKNRSLVPIKTDDLERFNTKEIQRDRLVKIPRDILNGVSGISDQKKTLMITDLGVVEDPSRTFNPCTQVGNPNGAWTFGQLMKQMASSGPSPLASNIQVSDFVRNWLITWRTDQTVNGELIDSRTSIQNIISDWETKSNVNPGGILDMKFAPFKLIAIVNRLDLRGNSGYGFSSAGEGRLVFNALTPNCNAMQFTVIFEYGINKRSCSSVKAFAQEWDNLNSLLLGSSPYNSALENITNQFVLAGTNPSKPNQNSINQIRTNEIAIGNPWELREFNLKSNGQLELVTVKQEPAIKYNTKNSNSADVRRLVAFINANEVVIENNNYTVPESVPLNPPNLIPTTPFRGGKSHTFSPSHHWNGSNSPGNTFVNSDLARHTFSLNTCSGCHGGETNTVFTHIKPSGFQNEAGLSGFLTGITVTDPANRPMGNSASRPFNDLLRREGDLANLISNNCINRPFFELAHKLTFEPLRMTH